jgi:hypothetical protein
MKSTVKANDLETRARTALQTLLQQVSTIELKGIELKVPDAGWETNFLVRIRVLGRNHTLACRLAPGGDAQTVRKVLREMHDNAATCSDGSIPVIIAPYLSPEMRAHSADNKIGYVDLEGNARLLLGEVFISERSLPVRDLQTVELPQLTETVTVRKFAPIRLSASAAERALPAITAA